MNNHNTRTIAAPPSGGEVRWGRWALLCFAWAVMGVSSGCYAGYAGSVSGIHAALSEGNMASALREANAALGVDDGSQPPSVLTEETPLLLLERAALLQGVGRHKDAARDFAEADGVMEVLDLSADDAGNVGKYLFSDDSSVYKAPPHEKVLVNTLAMISYLAERDLEGARVEARRLAVMQKFLADAAPEEMALYGLGSYLAGFSFEQSGQPDDALRFYMEAYDNGYEALAPQIVALSDATGFEHDIVTAARAQAPGATRVPEGQGEVLVVVQNGRAPYKRAERIPIGAFLVQPVADARWQMSADQRSQADRLVAEGALKWINFPVLEQSQTGLRAYGLSVGGRSPEPQLFMDIEQCTFAAWEQDKGKLMFAAFTRMLARALAGNAAEVAGKSSGLDKKLFPGASFLLGAVVEGGLAAADTPDTRSWTLLPATIQVYRLRVPAGAHRVTLSGGGAAGAYHSLDVNVPSRSYAVASFRFF